MARSQQMLIGITAILLYLGLAVLGWGGFGPFVAQPARVVLVLVVLLLTFAAAFTEGNVSPGEREDRSNRWVIPAITVIGLLNAYLAPYTDRKDIWTLDGDAVRWIGVALTGIGGVLRLWPVFVLGNRFSGLVAIQPGHRLVTSGIYGVIRHPSYLGLLLGAFGWVLAFRSGIGVLLTVPLIPIIIARIRAEEALLNSHFGAEYERYRSHTWRLVPGLY